MDSSLLTEETNNVFWVIPVLPLCIILVLICAVPALLTRCVSTTKSEGQEKLKKGKGISVLPPLPPIPADGPVVKVKRLEKRTNPEKERNEAFKSFREDRSSDISIYWCSIVDNNDFEHYEVLGNLVLESTVTTKSSVK